MKIGVIGGNGFIGNSVLEIFANNHEVCNINKKTYELYNDHQFDVIIDINGNSNKHWGNNNPVEDFERSVLSVFKSIHKFIFKKYIYISSIDVEIPIKSSYGFNKYIAEKLIRFHCKNYSIVRIPAVIGKNAVKGIVYDILNENIIFLSKNSTLMLIEVNEIGSILKTLLENNQLKKLERLYPKNNITIEEIGNILKIPVNYNNDLRSEYFNHKGTLNTSNNYLKRIT